MLQYVILAIPYLLQLLCIIHIFRTGRNTFWVYIVIFVPYVGGIAYLVVEVLPSLRMGAKLPQIVDIVVNVVNPSKKVRDLEHTAEYVPSAENVIKLAECYLDHGYFEKALGKYDSLLAGFLKDDTQTMLNKAKAHYGLKEYLKAQVVLDRLSEMGYSYRNEGEEMIRLKNLEHIIPFEKTLELYQSVKTKYKSFEISYYLMDFLYRNGQAEALETERKEVYLREMNLKKAGYRFDKTWIRLIRGIPAASGK
jgi:hypothetical protein